MVEIRIKLRIAFQLILFKFGNFIAYGIFSFLKLFFNIFFAPFRYSVQRKIFRFQNQHYHNNVFVSGSSTNLQNRRTFRILEKCSWRSFNTTVDYDVYRTAPLERIKIE